MNDDGLASITNFAERKAAWLARKQGAPRRETPELAPVPQADAGDDRGRAYCLRALALENDALAATQPGGRNHQLNASAFSLAQLVATGYLSEHEIRTTLGATATRIGLGDSEIRATLTSGISAGLAQPRAIPDGAEWASVTEVDAAALLSPHDGAPQAEEIWALRPELAHIHQFAHARTTSPWAVLGGCLLRALCCMPPTVVTPALIGGVGSLNALVSLVGPSGAGKGASDSTAEDAFTWPLSRYARAPLGSGEGITHAYAHPMSSKEKKMLDEGNLDKPVTSTGLVIDHESVLFTSPEIDQVAAQANRRGATLMPQLRSAYSGEQLGFQYADTTRRIILPKHSYRFGLSVGVQPERGEFILGDADGGTPQRFIWLPVTDPTIPDQPPDEPTPLPWTTDIKPRICSVNRAGLSICPVPDEIAHTIRANHLARSRGAGDALDGHALFTRLKITFALAFLNQRTEINMEDWEIAGLIMQRSDATRASIQFRLDQRHKEADMKRTLREAERQELLSSTLADKAIARVARLIGRKAKAAGSEGIAGAELRRNITSRDRDWFEDALNNLAAAGQVSFTESSKGGVVTWIGE